MELRKWKVGAAAAAVLALGGFGLASEAAKGKKTAEIRAAETLTWADGPMKGVKVAALWGDMTKNAPFGALIKFEPGLMHPLHWHSQTLKLLIVSGTFLHRDEGGMEVRLAPGSYLVQPANSRHMSGCAPGNECLFLMQGGGRFDFKTPDTPPVEKK